MKVFAHRGASSDYPENTILAFKHGINVGANGLELDVHKTKDGVVVVIHDEDIQRTFKGKGLVKDYELEELKKIKCRKAVFRENEECIIPTLEEVLLLIKDREDFTINIELKTDVIHYENIEQDVITLLNKYDMCDRAIISSFNHESIRICKAIKPEIKIGALYHYTIENVIKYALCLGVDAIHPNIELVTQQLIDECHKNNIKVNTYTANSPDVMRKLIDSNVDGIFTDYPELLLEVINEKK